MKYILLESEMNDGNIENIPIIFPKTLNHIDVKEAIERVLIELAKRKSVKCVGAGDCNLSVFHVGGNSSTLNVHSRRAVDHSIIQMIDYFPFKIKD